MREPGAADLERGVPMLLRWAWPLPRLLVGLAALACCSWEGVQGRSSTASHAGILAVVAVVVLLALVAGRGAQRERSGTWLRGGARALRSRTAPGTARAAAVVGARCWALLIAATIGWDALSFAEQERSLPTLSRLFGDVTGHDWGRALVFAAWLALGLTLALRWRAPTGRAQAHPGPRGPRTRRRLRWARPDEKGPR